MGPYLYSHLKATYILPLRLNHFLEHEATQLQVIVHWSDHIIH